MRSEPLWTVADIVDATGGRLHGTVELELNGIAIDSRSIAKGDVFVAIKGDKLDGHAFAASALRGGAGLAVVARVDAALADAGPHVLLDDDPLDGLRRMAVAARTRSRANIVAVTGSVGKTSTKEMLHIALAASGSTHASTASFNNHWGVPLSLARMHKQSAYGVFEVGMNHAGEITPLVEMVRPHVAIVTNVAASHLGNFTSLDDIAAAKAEIFRGLVKNGTAVINRDSQHFNFLKSVAQTQGAKVLSFGRDKAADVCLKAISLQPEFSCISASVCGTEVAFKLGLPGEHMAINSLAVLAAVHALGADMTRAMLALADAQPAKGRGVQQHLRVPDGNILLLDESYNANPASMRAALALLGQLRPGRAGRRIAVLGDMLELGDFAPALHSELAAVVSENSVDVLYAAGPMMAHLWNQTPLALRGAYAASSAELASSLIADVRAGDVVMIKGSLGSRMGPLAEQLRATYEAVNGKSN